MADTALRTQAASPLALAHQGTDWGAIWGGVFIFSAIWTVFESLALAIFRTPAATSGMEVGMAIWTIILTIIAMYVAGLETGRLAGITTRHDGLIHGLMFFGLVVVSAVVLTVLTFAVLSYGPTATASTHSLWAASLTSGMLWTAFLSLFLGWLAAMGGASTGIGHKNIELEQPVPVRPAA